MTDSREIARLLARRLVERTDAKAKQMSNGGYFPVRDKCQNIAVDGRCGSCETCTTTIKFSGQDVIDHIDGKATYGHYVVRPDTNTCRMFVFDIDLRAKANPNTPDGAEPPIMFDGVEIDPRKVWAGPVCDARRDLLMQMRAMAEGLAINIDKLLDIPVLVSYSGNKGMHVYGLLDPGTPADEARMLGRSVLDMASGGGLFVQDKGSNFFKHAENYPALQIELFPKQDAVDSGGFGNLVRLPLGINQKSGKPGFFVDLSTDIRKTGRDNAMEALTHGSLRHLEEGTQ